MARFNLITEAEEHVPETMIVKLNKIVLGSGQSVVEIQVGSHKIGCLIERDGKISLNRYITPGRIFNVDSDSYITY